MTDQSRRPGLFNVSIDTGVLFAMLIAAVYFGAMLRSDLDHTIVAIGRLEDTITSKQVDLAKEVAEIKQRLLVLENRPPPSPVAP